MINNIIIETIKKTNLYFGYNTDLWIVKLKIVNTTNEKILEYTYKEHILNYDIKKRVGYDCNGYIEIYKYFVDYYTEGYIITNLIKTKYSYYFNYNDYKYKLYLILKNAFGKDLSKFILQLMIRENKKEVSDKLLWYENLCKTYKSEDMYENKKLYVDELFTIFDGITELNVNIK